MHNVWHVHYQDIVPAVYAQANKSLQQCHDELSEALSNTLLNPSKQFITAAYNKDDDKIIGFACVFSSEDTESTGSFFELHGFDAELERFYVHPDFQRRGVGQKLLTQTANWCHKHNKNNVCLWTFAENRMASDFYSKNGARIYKEVSYNYIEREAPLWIMCWDDFPTAILTNNKVA